MSRAIPCRTPRCYRDKAPAAQAAVAGAGSSAATATEMIAIATPRTRPPVLVALTERERRVQLPGRAESDPDRAVSCAAHLALTAGVRRRFAPHQLRHAHAVELMHEGIPLPLIQRQLGHSHLSTTGTYLEGINTEEIMSTVHARRAPMMHASAGLAL